MVRVWPFLTVFVGFWPFFFLITVTQCDKHFFFIKHSDSVWQTFFLNTLTECAKHFLKNSDLFFSGKLILRKKLKIYLPLKNKFQHRRKIGVEYLKNKIPLCLSSHWRHTYFKSLQIKYWCRSLFQHVSSSSQFLGWHLKYDIYLFKLNFT